MSESNYGYFVYGINEFKEYNNGFYGKQNSNLLAMYYGKNKAPFVFRKQDSYKLLCCLTGKKFTSKEMFQQNVDNVGYVKTLNFYLKGRAVVILSEKKDINCYYEPDDEILGVTSVSLNGRYYAESIDDLFPNNVTYAEKFCGENHEA